MWRPFLCAKRISATGWLVLPLTWASGPVLTSACASHSEKGALSRGFTPPWNTVRISQPWGPEMEVSNTLPCSPCSPAPTLYPPVGYLGICILPGRVAWGKPCPIPTKHRAIPQEALRSPELPPPAKCSPASFNLTSGSFHFPILNPLPLTFLLSCKS